MPTRDWRGAALGACFLALLLPWINPFSGGPSSSVQPWLASALCVAVVFATSPPARLNPAMVLSLAGLAAWASARSGLTARDPGAWRRLPAHSHGRRHGRGRSAPQRVRRRGGAGVAGGRGGEHGDRAVPVLRRGRSASPPGSMRRPPARPSPTCGSATSSPRSPRSAWPLCSGCSRPGWLAGPRWWRWPGWRSATHATTSRTGLLQMIAAGRARVPLAGAAPPARDAVARRADRLWRGRARAAVVAGDADGHARQPAVGARRIGRCVQQPHRAVVQRAAPDRASSPWLGWGWGELDYAHYATLYDGPRFCDILDNAHNLPLHLAVELGIPGRDAALRRPGVGGCARARPGPSRSRRARWPGLCWR